MKKTYQQIKAAPDTTGMNIPDRVAFHYFNDAGIVADWKRVCSEISIAVRDGLVPSGWIIAYGSLNHHAEDSFTSLYRKKRVSSIELSTALDRLRGNIETAKAKLAEVRAETADLDGATQWCKVIQEAVTCDTGSAVLFVAEDMAQEEDLLGIRIIQRGSRWEVLAYYPDCGSRIASYLPDGLLRCHVRVKQARRWGLKVA